MKRNIENFLSEWKNNTNRMPLLVRGARQVGKSYTICEFGRNNFDNLVEINFEQFPKYKECFNTLDPGEIIETISILHNSKIIPGKTLLFLDEIQECPGAITALRYFYEQMPALHVIGAGSLLEFSLLKENFRMPVGRIQNIFMKPMSFTEFLDAIKEDMSAEFINTASIKKPADPSVHDHLLSLVRKYMITGGMPAVIYEYTTGGNLQKCQQIQSAIIQTYRNDFGKYASRIKHRYLEKIFFSVPKMTGRKFKYSHVDDSIQSRDLKEALELLELAGIVFRIKKTGGGGLPLEADADEKNFKTAFLDTGLMQNICGLTGETILNKDLIQINRGSLAEQFVSQELIAYQEIFFQPSLYYWAREARNSSAEVDFLIPSSSFAVPVEVKAGKTGTLRSLRMFLEKYPSPVGIRISGHPLSVTSSIISIPFYFISRISEIVNSHLTAQ